jgi:hypothetical protein
MLKEFERYCILPNSMNTHNLFHSMMDYEGDFSITAELYSIKRYFNPEDYGVLKAKTNGTTRSGGQIYEFSDNFHSWRNLIEKKFRGHDSDIIVVKSCTLQENKLAVPEVILKDDPTCNVMIQLDLSIVSHIEFLLSYLGSYGKQFNIMSSSDFWLYITTSGLMDVLVRIPGFHKFVNCDWELFAKKSIEPYMMDQMVDWSTGLNFYTCDFGHKHILPMFHEGNNLLNLRQMEFREVDDLLEIGKALKCACGRRRYDFEFRSHAGSWTEFGRGLLDQLAGVYWNLQFLESPWERYVCYISMSDEIRGFMDGVTYLEGQYYPVGRKAYNFWNRDEIIGFKRPWAVRNVIF